MAFKFKITQDIFDLFPEYKVGGLVLTDIKKRKNPENSIENIARNLVNELLKRRNYFPTSPSFINWQKIFKTLNLDEQDCVASHIALTKRILKSAQLMRINDLVDLYNIVSLFYSIPLGGHSISGINEITVGKTRGGELFKTMNSDEEVKIEAGEFAYLDIPNNHVLTRNFVWRQGDYSKVMEGTTDLFVPIDDGAGVYTDRGLELIACDLIGLLEIFFDFDYKFAIASKANPVIHFDEISFKPEPKKPLFLLTKSNVNTDDSAIAAFFDRKLADIFPTKDEFEKALKSGRRLRFYMGADCTAPKLHIGHMIPFMKMAELQKLGHQIIFLIGDFTGRIGDPTDKTAVRVQLTPEAIALNAAEFKHQVSKIIDFEDKDNPAIMVFNSEWNEQLKFQDVIELCTNFTVQQMLERDMFANRMKENKPIYLHEFMYPLMQGYDSVYMEVDGEFGGKDQTFNMLAGRHLMKMIKDMEKFVITVPTLLSSDGVTKMSKSIGNCIFLTDTPNDKFGKIMAIPDNLIIHYYQLITNLSDTEVANIGQLDPMEAKKRLGYILVESLDGKEAAEQAKGFFEKTIQEGQAPDNTPSSSRNSIKTQLGEKPEVKQLIVFLELAPSNSEAKRLIQSGAVEIDGNKITDINATLDIQQVNLIKVGKRGWHKFLD